jgi:FAD/FMN-containing dehydrogenase
MVVDLSRMNGLEMDARHVLTAGPGCRLAGLFDLLLPRERIIPTGSCGGVGIAGLTLGGGYGMFSGKYGLTCDHLTGVRMVDGRGRIRDSGDDPELLWACRGGGNGSFGIVTRLTFATRPAPERLHSFRFKARGLDPRRGTALLSRWFEVAASLPPEAFSAFVLGGRSLTVLVTTFVTRPGADFLRGPIAELGAAMDEAAPVVSAPPARAVKRYYGRSAPLHFKNVSAGFYRGVDDLRSVAHEIFRRVAARPGLLFQVNTFGGNADDPVIGRSSAFPHRRFRFVGELQSYWESPSREAALVDAVRGIQRVLWENGVRAHYANYPDADLPDWAEAYYGESYPRLQAVKRALDPDDVVRHPQSVRLPRA